VIYLSVWVENRGDVGGEHYVILRNISGILLLPCNQNGPKTYNCTFLMKEKNIVVTNASEENAEETVWV
jgi:aspartyl-tRNA synthetase